jgi:hypothetical protein
VSVLVGAWGCVPSPELVYVDLDAAELRETAPVSLGGGFSAEALSHEESIADLEGQDLLIGSAEERAVRALEVYRKAQEQAAQAVLDRLETAYLAEVALYESTEATALREEYARWLDTELQELHEVFVEHARRVEPLRYELTRLVGFPDPDPNSVKVPLQSNVRAYQNHLAAKAVRGQIKALGDAFRQNVAGRLERVDRERTERLNAISAQGEAMRQDALRRAQAEANAVSESALPALERTVLDPEARLSPVAGASSSVNSRAVTVPAAGESNPPVETRADLESQLQVFLKTFRYRMTKSPTLGRNVTQEFVEWRRKYVAGL